MASSAAGSGELLVFEYGGEARSGKGTIVECLSARPGIAKEETGVDYRFLTKSLLDQSVLDPSMDPADIPARLQAVSFDELVELLTQKEALLAQTGRQVLYEDDVNRLVPDVAQLKQVRKAVKTGFAKRVEAIRDSQNYQAVAIDGRNLSGVVKEIQGVKMRLRTFVRCSAIEAALRECARENIDPVSAEGQRKLESIKARNHKDQTREEDPMCPDDDAIDYWQGSNAEASLRQLSEAGSTEEYLSIIADRLGTFSSASLPPGIGRAAALASEQILFDTTVFRLFENPKEAMLLAAEQMFDEALALKP